MAGWWHTPPRWTIHCHTSPGGAGQPVTVRAVVRNVGGARSAPLEVRLLDGDGVAAAERVEAAAGEAVPVDFAWTPAAGERELVVEVGGLRATRHVWVSPP